MGAGAVQCSCDELLGEPLPLEARVDLGVDECDQLTAAPVLREACELSVEVDLEAIRVGNISHLDLGHGFTLHPADRRPVCLRWRAAILDVMPDVCITEFTDPGCPWAFSAEPFRRRLNWLYGERLEWRTVMVGLADSPAHYEAMGFGPEKQASALRRSAHDHRLPIDTTVTPRRAGTN